MAATYAGYAFLVLLVLGWVAAVGFGHDSRDGDDWQGHPSLWRAGPR